MSAIPSLKKKLKSIRATEKLSKAMKTVSAVKYAKLSSNYKNYSLYAKQYEILFREANLLRNSETVDSDVIIVLGSNRGFCGGFNHDIFNYVIEKFKDKFNPINFIICGEEIANIFSSGGYNADNKLIFNDVPTFSDCEKLYGIIKDKLKSAQNDNITIIRPFYKNTLTQIPITEVIKLNPNALNGIFNDFLCFPDEKTISDTVFERGVRALIFRAIIETALGAQASTLMTMRSAYDTAVEYGADIERKIQHLRQSEVTADVIENSSERLEQGR